MSEKEPIRPTCGISLEAISGDAQRERRSERALSKHHKRNLGDGDEVHFSSIVVLYLERARERQSLCQLEAALRFHPRTMRTSAAGGRRQHGDAPCEQHGVRMKEDR